MIKFIKLLIGLLLLPLCTAVTLCAYRLLSESATADFETLSTEEWALPIGFATWAIIYLIFPKPWRTYILGHELTHALWGLLMGARIGKMKIEKDGGSVELSKSNFLIALSPYFFPLYTVIVIVIYTSANHFIDLSSWRGAGLALVGFTWSFHATFTISMLSQCQSDVDDHGQIFSHSIIYLFNLLGICCWITAIGKPDWDHFITLLVEHSGDCYNTTWDYLSNLPAWVMTGIEYVRHTILPH